MTPTHTSPSRPLHWSPLGLLCVFLFAATLPMEAARTPAGTVIRNQAKITYQLDDETGRLFESSSNEVLLEVLPIFGIEITPDHTAPYTTSGNEGQRQIARATQSVTLQYILTFTGNVADTATIRPDYDPTNSTFRPQLADGDTGLLVYKDANADGIVDASDVLVASWRDANLDGIIDDPEISVTTLGLNYQPDETESLLINFLVPAGTAAGSVAFLNLEGESAGDPTQTDTNNFARIDIADGSIMTVRKTVDVSTAAPGDSLTYTITAENTGNAAAIRRALTVNGSPTPYAGVLILDVLPSNEGTGSPFLLDAAATITIQPGGVNGSILYSTRAVVTGSSTDPRNDLFDPTEVAWGWTTTFTPATAYTVVAYLSGDNSTQHDLAASDEVTFSLTLDTPATAPNQVVENLAYAHYGDGSNFFTVAALNRTLTNLEGGVDVLIRDTDFETVHPTPRRTPANDSIADTQTLASAPRGRSAYFTNRVVNTGSVPETFNITLDGTSNLPAGWNLTFLRSDGLTPLPDTGSDGIPDTGVLQPSNNPPNHTTPQADAYLDIVVRVDIPEVTPDLGGDVTLIIRASSASQPPPLDNSARTDTTTNLIEALSELALDIENNIGQPADNAANENSVTKTGDAGGFVDFPLIVLNKAPADGETDTYSMSATFPDSTWAVTFYRDANSDGVLDASEAQPAFSTPPVAANAHTFMIARVFLPDSIPADSDYQGTATSGDDNDPYSITFRATSNLDASKFDEITNLVEVNFFNRFQLEADRLGVIEAGGTTNYTHTIRNFSDRANRFYLKLTGGTADWRYLILEDDATGTLLPTATAPDGNTYPYIDLAARSPRTNASTASEGSFRLRLFAPAGVPQGTIDVTTLQALAWDPGSNDNADQWDEQERHFANDITSVVAGDLRLTKTSSPAYATAVKPGEEITYTTNFQNLSAGSLSDVIIYDQISPHTSYKLVSGVVTGVSGNLQLSRNGGISYSADSANAGDPDATVTNLRVVLDAPLLPGQSGSYAFTVFVK